ncbi:MAG: transposase [Butyrivibrio sp.]
MGTKDIKAKEYLADNARFADLCNAVLFDGEQVISPEALMEGDPEEVLSVYDDGKEKASVKRMRDILKSAVIKSTGKSYVVIVGVESQADIHYAMVVKDMLYDALNYGAQIKNIERNHRRNRDGCTEAEFLSGFCKDDILIPVITITLYLGPDRWDGARHLHEMFGDIGEGLKKYIPDYFINLVSPYEIEDFSKFKTTLGEVLEVIKYSQDKNRLRKLMEEDPQFRKMDWESVSVINSYAGTRIPFEGKGGKADMVDMCKAWVDWKEEGREEGREDGTVRGIIRMGRACNAGDEKIIEMICRETGMDREKARESMENL